MNPEMRVPAEMVKYVIRSRYGTADPVLTRQIEKDLEAALRWLDGELVKLSEAQEGQFTRDSCGYTRAIADVRSVFRIEEDVPEEIREIFTTATDLPMGWSGNEINRNLLEAYRRGQKSRKTK